MSDLAKFDEAVLAAISKAPGRATYVLRNMMTWPNDHWKVGFWPALETSAVLRACRRLQKRGLIEESPTAYAVMKCWRPTHPRQESGHG
ncbi:putative protein OS=Bosea thiooxidans OX=53254 GN=SAMN05660750_03297 PE=4 SV=1 [Bosea thiooxidans]|uniref:Uncharacterized protein n=1 Tax=Bosea thiooxidans TaxID=53254 RepID=A0A1T5FKD3_9HYPH|nr:hypothetical protein [Bosea thiooxidans]SKB96619.1 hypothetical protein SAMN05660750_03297 [Bosea thiooxidans]